VTTYGVWPPCLSPWIVTILFSASVLHTTPHHQPFLHTSPTTSTSLIIFYNSPAHLSVLSIQFLQSRRQSFTLSFHSVKFSTTPVSLVNSVFTFTTSILHPLNFLCKFFNHTSQSMSFSFYNHAVNHTRSQFSHIHEITVFLRSSSGTYLDMGGKYFNSHLQVPTLIWGKSIWILTFRYLPWYGEKVFEFSPSGTYLDMGKKYLNSHLQVPTLIWAKSIWILTWKKIEINFNQKIIHLKIIFLTLTDTWC